MMNATAEPVTEKKPEPTQTALAPQGKASGLKTYDDGQFANLLDSARFEHMWRVACLFAKSEMVPDHYRGKPENCFISVQMAVRLQMDPYFLMQNTYIVHGKPGMEAKLAIALINTSGLFADSLDYEVEGTDPKNKNYRVRAYAIRKSTGKRIEGPWVDWAVVQAEGWDSKAGSKWKTNPGMMFLYRSATFFGRLHCPERLMGMQTADELEDVGTPRYIEVQSKAIAPGESKTEALARRLGVNTETGEVVQVNGKPTPAKVDAKIQPETKPTGEPTDEEKRAIRWHKLSEALAGKCETTSEKAEAKLTGFVQKVLKKTPVDLTDAEFTDLAAKIEAGDIKV